MEPLTKHWLKCNARGLFSVGDSQKGANNYALEGDERPGKNKDKEVSEQAVEEDTYILSRLARKHRITNKVIHTLSDIIIFLDVPQKYQTELTTPNHPLTHTQPALLIDFPILVFGIINQQHQVLNLEATLISVSPLYLTS